MSWCVEARSPTRLGEASGVARVKKLYDFLRKSRVSKSGMTNIFCIAFFLPSLCQAQIFDQLSNSKDETPIIINADESVVYDEKSHTCTATGAAQAQKGTFFLNGDILTVFFSDMEAREITAITAEGNVQMKTPTETAYGRHVHYDAVLDRILMTGGNLRIVTPKEILTARDSIEYWHTDNKGIARGQAKVRFPEKEQFIQADRITAYFKSASQKDGKETQIDRLEGEGHVLACGTDGTVTGDRGKYGGDSQVVEMFGDVAITQGDNIIQGGYGRANLKTNLAEIFTHPPHTKQKGPAKRVSGIIIPKSLKDREKRKPHRQR